MSNLTDFIGGSGGSGGVDVAMPTKITEITTLGTTNFIVPVTGTYLISICGGGGGGGGRYSSSNTAAGGGSAGLVKKQLILNKGEVIPVTIGAGGAHAISADNSSMNNAGSSGKPSSFGTYITAIGGNASMGRTAPYPAGVNNGGDASLSDAQTIAVSIEDYYGIYYFNNLPSDIRYDVLINHSIPGPVHGYSNEGGVGGVGFFGKGCTSGTPSYGGGGFGGGDAGAYGGNGGQGVCYIAQYC